MRFRELTLRPLAGSPSPGGEARVHRLDGDGKTLAVVHGKLSPTSIDTVAQALRDAGHKGGLVVLAGGVEFTLCEVEDGSPVRWKEDGRPSYQDLEKRVKELESMAAMGSGADCAPCTVKP